MSRGIFHGSPATRSRWSVYSITGPLNCSSFTACLSPVGWVLPVDELLYFEKLSYCSYGRFWFLGLLCKSCSISLSICTLFLLNDQWECDRLRFSSAQSFLLTYPTFVGGPSCCNDSEGRRHSSSPNDNCSILSGELTFQGMIPLIIR